MANQGIYHPTYNPNGSKKLSDGNFWYNTTIPIASTMDCFDSSKMLTASGNIGTTSARPDGIFYDQIAENSILDLRNSSKKVEDKSRLISSEFNKLVAGTYRGKEGEWEIVKVIEAIPESKFTNTTNIYITFTNLIPTGIGLSSGSSDKYYGVLIDAAGTLFKICDTHPSIASHIYLQSYYGINTAIVNITGPCKVVIFKDSTRTKSNTLLRCDIIGNPTNYPTAWKQSGVFGTPLIVAEDGTSLLPDGTRDSFKLSRKANATPLLCLRSTDNGATWTSFTPVFSTTSNAITLTDEPAGNLVLVYYQTKTSMAVPTINSEVLELGEVWAGNSQYTTSGGAIVGTLLNKVSTGSLAPAALFNGKITGFKFFNAPVEKLDIVSEYKPAHSNIPSLGTTASPAVKVFPYLTRLNGKAYLNLVFKEMKHNGTSWGDDAKFNIVDNVSTTTDNNAQTVLIGQKTVELPYFIAGDE